MLGLASSGIHSNGYSLVRRIIKEAKLDIHKVYPELDKERTLGEVLLEPTRIYVKSIVSVLRRYKVKQPIVGMAHITGGGLPGNLPRVLSNKINAKIKGKAWDVPPIFKFLQKHGNVDRQEMLRVFNMGIGYVVIVRPHFADSVAEQLERKGEKVFKLGKLTRGTGEVIIQ